MRHLATINGTSMDTHQIAIIDVAPLRNNSDTTSVAAEIHKACTDNGFFYITSHGIDDELIVRLEQLSREFFAQSESQKMRIAMKHGGRAWRGYFPVGDELTSGKPDQKEGLYFGSERGHDHPRVKAGVPLHGPNLFPEIPSFRETILAYLDHMTELGHLLMRGIALSLGLDSEYFRQELTWEPTILFRIFHYPPLKASDSLWSVGEHTDYGLLTILKQDANGGLQVKSRGNWIDASPVPGTFVCNIGDMLDALTGGHYQSTPHRVRNVADQGRLSFPFFFDPSWDARVQPIRHLESGSRQARWDGADLQRFRGTYGEYLTSKVAKVFPKLSEET